MTRQSPSSSRKRSTTSVVSDGTAAVAVRCSSISCHRLSVANASNPTVRQRSSNFSRSSRASSPVNAPIAAPSSAGRPTPSPRQNGSRAGSPGAGMTSTRSWVISVIRQLVAPSEITSPGRDS